MKDGFKKYLTSFIIIIAYIMINQVHADSFQAGLDAGAAHQNQAMNALKSFDPNSVFNNYTSSPSQTHYYGGVMQTSTTMGEDSAKAVSSDPAGKAVEDSFVNRPQFDLSVDSPVLQSSLSIENNAVDIVNGLSSQFADCTQQKTCTTTYETKTCESSLTTLEQYCKKTLTVDLVPTQTDTHYKFTAHLSTSSHNYGAIIFDLVSGKIVDKGPSDASGSLTGRLPSTVPCSSLHGQVTALRSSCKNTTLEYVYFPSCSGLTLNFKATCSGTLNLDLDVDIVSSTITQVPVDNWTDQCTGLSGNSLCTMESETCLEADTTHNVQGVSVTRSCWEYEDKYSCKAGDDSTNTCQPLIDQGCEQTNSVCENKTDSGCTLYSQTYSCPNKECTDNGVVCNGDTYCVTDDCFTHTKSSDPDFQKAISGLSTIDSAADEYNESGEYIFTGTKKSCDNEIVGFSNCCADDGWGIDLGLASCTQEEKELGEAKSKNEVVYVGSYCEKDTLGVCITHRKAYCVFPSVLDRIIQEQGRGNQLHISFGTGENPNCRGITPDELQAINFDLIDFTDFYDDIYAEENIEDPSVMEQQVDDQVKNLVG
jgi:conjugal transfer mating pair stabilization protein TraN